MFDIIAIFALILFAALLATRAYKMNPDKNRYYRHDRLTSDKLVIGERGQENNK